MKQEELRQTLTEFAAERVALLERHEAGARHIRNYDFNNAYQYVISREETHLQWLQTALAEFGDALPPPSTKLPVPDVAKSREKGDPNESRAIFDDDAQQLGAFIDRWRLRIAPMTHARHRKMLDVILGESREHQRVFEQAAAGIEDLLGRRTGGVPRRGSVLPARWLE